MESWLRQTARARVAEWIVVSPRPAAPEETALLARAPARWIEKPGTRYYGLKNEGIRRARGRFIALADSDALPADDWLESALAVLERSDPSVALLTGRTRYLPGPFSREMVIAQLPNQADLPHDTTHFLAHNVLLRAEAVRPLLFAGDAIRLGSDTHLAGRLIESGYRLRYDPSLRVTHNYGRHWSELYRHCMVIGYALGTLSGVHGRTAPEPPGRLRREDAGAFRAMAGVSATAGNSDPAPSSFALLLLRLLHGRRSRLPVGCSRRSGALRPVLVPADAFPS